MSPEFMRRAQREAAPVDSDQATARTVEIMCGHIRGSANDELVKRVARSSVAQYRGGPLFAQTGQNPFTNPQALAESVWWWAKTNLCFVHHSALILAWLGEREQLQLLISPDVLLHGAYDEGRPMKGDCAIYSALIAALLECLGVPWEIVTVAVNPSQPEIYSHVFIRAILPDGRRIPLDASHGGYAGWQVPAVDISRLQAWNSNGAPVTDQGSHFEGLHNYMRRTRRGLGDDNSSVTLPYYQETVAAGYDPNAATPMYVVSPGAAATPGFDWSNLIGNLATQWTKIGGQVIAPQTTLTRDAKGNLSYQTPGSSSALPTSLIGGTGGTSWLLIGGLAIGGLLLVKALGAK